MTYFALSWPLDPCLGLEGGDGCCINRPVCQLALSQRPGVGGCVTQNDTPPALNFSAVTRTKLALWSSSFFQPEPMALALYGLIRNYHYRPTALF